MCVKTYFKFLSPPKLNRMKSINGSWMFIFTALLYIKHAKGFQLKNQVLCLDGGPCKIVHRWPLFPKENITFTWYRFNEPVSSCTTQGHCTTYNGYIDWIIAAYKLVDGTMFNKLQFLVLSKNISGQWILEADFESGSIRFPFTVQTYKKIGSENCRFTTDADISLICFVPLALPGTRCRFVETIKKKHYTHVTYHTAPVHHNEYISFNCSIRLRVTENMENRFHFDVNIFHNSPEEVVHYGPHVSVSYCIGPPKVKYNCPEVVREGEELNCKCFKDDDCNKLVTIKLTQGTTVIAHKENIAKIKTTSEESMGKLKD
ncbi:uncharacterized protein LOC131930120 [Physella acuta]|uniref:uncharacterized protein LOC131930120 n=1 Tax=Physella acuta TaxID=109671 RepID=UPI0027DAC800|nr:uncharacterized protein LOC131930120 [Physella acuta]